MSTKYTPAPWFADENGMIWRRNPSELYQNGGGVAGDKPIATAHIGWIGEDLSGYPVKANARLIAAAPELLEALQTARSIVLAQNGNRHDDTNKAIAMFDAAIAKAIGEAK